MYPNIVFSVQANRAFLARTVRFLVSECGIRQFLDIGTGIPTANNTHEVAQRLEPSSRIVYVDNDPIVLTHAQALLKSHPVGTCDYIDADLHDPEGILAAAARTLDFSQPVAVMLIAAIHFVLDDDAARDIVATLMAACPPGSYLAITHAASDINPAQVSEMTRRLNESALAEKRITRDRSRRDPPVRRLRAGRTRHRPGAGVAPGIRTRCQDPVRSLGRRGKERLTCQTSTPPSPTAPASTTTGSAARTTLPRTGRWASGRSRRIPTSCSRCAPGGHSSPGRCDSSSTSAGSGSSSTSAPESRPRTTRTRSRSGSSRVEPHRLRRQRPHRLVARQGAAEVASGRHVRLHRRGPARPGRNPGRGRPDAGLQPAGRGHAHRGPSVRRGRRRGQPDRRQADGAVRTGQLPGDLASGQRHRPRADGGVHQALQRGRRPST